MPTNRLSLLIADDDAGWRTVVEEVLSEQYQTLVVPSGHDAIEIVSSGEVDFALCDVHMGDVTGLDVAEYVYERDIFLPCVLMTAELTGDVIQRATDVGVARVLSKPVSLDDLVTTVSVAASLVTERLAD